MDGFPSLPPPTHSPSQKETGNIFDCEQLEKDERWYENWLSELHQCPHQTPVGVRQLDLSELGMELEEEEEEEESLEDSEEEEGFGVGDDLVVFGEESDTMEDSSVQDNSAFNDSI